MGNILCDLDPKVKVKGKKLGICNGVPSTAALVFISFYYEKVVYKINANKIKK